MNGVAGTPAQAAARLVVDDGLEYGAAKRKAARDLERRGGRRSELPSNEAVEDEVREYLALFQADTQPGRARIIASPGLDVDAAPVGVPAPPDGRGLARHRDPAIDDPHRALSATTPKPPRSHCSTGTSALEALGQADGPDLLRIEVPCPELGETVSLFLHVLDHDDLRGGLKPDTRGRTWRGDVPALQRLMDGGAT